MGETREEIVEAARSLARDAAAGKLDPAAIDCATFASRLYTADLPEPAQFLDDVAALIDAERLVVGQRGEDRIEVVGFLGDVNNGNTQGQSPATPSRHATCILAVPKMLSMTTSFARGNNGGREYRP